MASKLSKSDSAPADYISTTPNPSVSAVHDRLYDVATKVGGIERSVTYLEGRTEKMEAKLEAIALEVHSAKKTIIVIGSIISLAVSGIGAIGLVLLNKMLDLVIHHFTTGTPTH